VLREESEGTKLIFAAHLRVSRLATRFTWF
jgi:hypothetical protein